MEPSEFPLRLLLAPLIVYEEREIVRIKGKGRRRRRASKRRGNRIGWDTWNGVELCAAHENLLPSH